MSDDSICPKCGGPTVHVLLHGRVLCGNVHGVPASWDESQMWTGLAEWQEATCQQCRAVAELLVELRRMNFGEHEQ